MADSGTLARSFDTDFDESRLISVNGDTPQSRGRASGRSSGQKAGLVLMSKCLLAQHRNGLSAIVTASLTQQLAGLSQSLRCRRRVTTRGTRSPSRPS